MRLAFQQFDTRVQSTERRGNGDIPYSASRLFEFSCEHYLTLLSFQIRFQLPASHLILKRLVSGQDLPLKWQAELAPS